MLLKGSLFILFIYLYQYAFYVYVHGYFIAKLFKLTEQGFIDMAFVVHMAISMYLANKIANKINGDSSSSKIPTNSSTQKISLNGLSQVGKILNQSLEEHQEKKAQEFKEMLDRKILRK